MSRAEDKFREKERQLQGRLFEFKGIVYKCLEVKFILSRKLIIKTITRTLVLVESDLKNLVVKAEPVTRMLKVVDIKKKIIAIDTKEVIDIIEEANICSTDSRTNKPWSIEEDSIIQAKLDKIINISYREIGETIGRPAHCVSQRAYFLRKSVKLMGLREEANIKGIQRMREGKEFLSKFIPTEIEPTILFKDEQTN